MRCRSLVTMLIVLLTALSAAAMSACGGGGGGGGPTRVSTPPAIPDAGLYLGALLLEGQTTMADFNSATGLRHAIFAEFLEFPEVLDTQGADYAKVSAFISACKAAGAIPMLTLESFGGLSSYSAADIEAFAAMLYDFDVSLILRWNHEMNGSWYPWGQQPTLYIQKFQEFAAVMHAAAPNVAMAWTPNQGWGYPWPGGAFSIAGSSPDFAILDTDGDGELTEADDPYGPYYPGDASVDWVGHSFYHWSNGADRGINEVPSEGKWGRANGIGDPVPNFHDLFAVAHGKPMMIAETSALYDPADRKGGGASEADIKREWIRQVYHLDEADASTPAIPSAFPRLKAILWFSQEKYEQEVGGEVDWTLTSDPQVLEAYRQAASDPFFVKAP